MPEFDDKVAAAIENIDNTLSERGAFIKFYPETAAMDPLKKALDEIFNVYFQKQGAARQSQHQSEEADAQRRRQLINEHARNINRIIGKHTRELGNKIDSQESFKRWLDKQSKGRNAANAKKFKQLTGHMTNIWRVGKEIVGAVKELGRLFYTLSKDRVETLAALRESGISLREGFDEAFYKYAMVSGKTKDELVQFLKRNSKFNAQLNASNINGAAVLANAANQLRKSMGLSRNEIDSVIEYYGERLHTAGNDTKLATIDYNNEILSTAKMLKMLAVATGQSTDQIIQHTKEQGKTWQLERLRTSPKYRDQYAALKAIGMDDDLIESYLLNKPSAAKIKFQLTPGGQALDRDLTRWVRETRGQDAETITRSLMAVINGPGGELFRRQEAYWDEHLDQIKFHSEEGMKIFSGSWALTTGRVKMDENGALRAVNPNDKETASMIAMSNMTAAMNNVHSALMDAISPTLGQTANFLNALTPVIRKIGNFIAEHPRIASTAFWGITIAGVMGKGFLSVVGPALQYKIGRDMVRHGIGPTLLGYLRRGAVFFGKTLIGILSGMALANGIAAATGQMEHWKGINIGSMIGGVIGMIWGPLGSFIGSIAGGFLGWAISKLLGLGDTEEADVGSNIVGETITGLTEEPARGTGDRYASSYSEFQPAHVSYQSASPSKSEIKITGMSGLQSSLATLNNTTRYILDEIRGGKFTTGTNASIAAV